MIADQEKYSHRLIFFESVQYARMLHYTWIKMLDTDKHSSLLGLFVINEQCCRDLG